MKLTLQKTKRRVGSRGTEIALDQFVAHVTSMK
jgi:hypothetical protein